MGNKVHPISFRLHKLKNWSSLWYNSTSNNDFLHQDILIKEFLKNFFFLRNISVSNIYISRDNNNEIKIYLNLILIDGFLSRKLPFNLLSKKFLQLNRKFRVPFLNYSNLNVLNTKGTKILTKKTSFSNLETELLSKSSFVTKKGLVRYKHSFIPKKEKFVFKTIKNSFVLPLITNVTILDLNNPLFFRYSIFKLNNLLVLNGSNGIFKATSFFNDLVKLNYKTKLTIRRRRFNKKKFNLRLFKFNKQFFKQIVKYRDYLNFIVLQYHLSKKNNLSLLTKYLFFVNNFESLQLEKKTNKLQVRNIFFTKKISFNCKLKYFQQNWGILLNGVSYRTIKRPIFSSISKIILLNSNKISQKRLFFFKSFITLKKDLNLSSKLDIISLRDTKKSISTRQRISSFLKLYTLNFFISKKKHTMYLNKKFNFINLNTRISYLFTKKFLYRNLKKRSPDIFKKEVLLKKEIKQFTNKFDSSTTSSVKKVILSTKSNKMSKFLKRNVFSFDKTLFVKPDYLILLPKEVLAISKGDLIRKTSKNNVISFKFKNITGNFNLFLNERYYYFILIKYNLSFLNKVITKITTNKDIQWEIFINKRKNLNSQDLGTYIKKNLKKRRHQRRLINPIDLVKNQLGDAVVYANKIKKIKGDIISKNLFNLFYKNNKPFIKNISSINSYSIFYKSIDQLIWNYQFNLIENKLKTVDLTILDKKDLILKNEVDTFYISKLNLVKKRKNFLLTKNPIFYNNISYYYKKSITSEIKNNLVRDNNLLLNQLKNSFSDLLGNLKKKSIFLLDRDIISTNIDTDITTLLNKQFLFLVKGFQVMGFGRLGSSSKSTRSNVTMYRIGKTMQNSFNLHIDYDFKTQITRNGIYGIKVSKFYETFDIKQFIEKNSNSFLI